MNAYSIDDARKIAHAELFAAKLSEMRPRFTAALAGRLEEMETVRDSETLYQDLGNAIELFRYNAHKTAGMAATMGFHELGLLCQQAEAAINLLMSAPEQMESRVEGALNAVDDMLGEMALVVYGN